MKIELSYEHREADSFRYWLINRGIDATIGRSTGNYVDGVWTSADEGANTIIRALWNMYCNGWS